ncbi:hypothetical protein PIB30_066387 [Stylosanthes scabra]|uniref:Uncharacterized protein n=1 Tax=Stylosanthes scabra TaxID=79078 RepID=A0ABU6VKL8_9FABA|nr:hypothetical protein [Stylosanthes scabra]
MDRNTKFFHAVVKSRQRKKRVESLKINKRCFHGKNWILQEVRKFFKSLYTEEEFMNANFEDSLVKKINSMDSQQLERLPEVEEIRMRSGTVNQLGSQVQMVSTSDSYEKCGM